MRAAAVLSRLPAKVALDGSGVVMEVYPSIALRQWGYPPRGYKGKKGSAVREEIVFRFLAETSEWLAISPTVRERCAVSDHALDALVAALVARAAAIDLVLAIPPTFTEEAIREGWIAVPTLGSLNLLSA